MQKNPPLFTSKDEKQSPTPFHERTIGKRQIVNNFPAISFRKKLVSTLAEITPPVRINPRSHP